MDKAPLMHPAERFGDRKREAQKALDFEPFPDERVERLAAGIVEHERHAVVTLREHERPCRPVAIELGPQRVFMFKPPYRLQ